MGNSCLYYCPTTGFHVIDKRQMERWSQTDYDCMQWLLRLACSWTNCKKTCHLAISRHISKLSLRQLIISQPYLTKITTQTPINTCTQQWCVQVFNSKSQITTIKLWVESNYVAIVFTLSLNPSWIFEDYNSDSKYFNSSD